MLPSVVVPWIRLGHIGASDYNLDALVVRSTGATRMIRGVVPRASVVDGRWIGVTEKDQRPIAIGSDGSVRASGLRGRFMTESDFGGELAISPRLSLSALVSERRLVLQRWQNGVGGRIVGTLDLHEVTDSVPTGAAWDVRGRLAISANEGSGWLYLFQNGRMRLIGRPRYDGAVIGWVGDRVLVHQKLPWTNDAGVLRPRLTTATGRTISIGPEAVAVGTDGRIIVLVTREPGRAKKRRESLSWRTATWRRLAPSVPLPTATGSEYDERTMGSTLLPLTPRHYPRR